MASNTILTMFFVHNPTGEGWRESIATSTGVDLGFVNLLNTVLPARRQCLVSDTSIYAIRSANSGPPKNIQLVHLNPPVAGMIGSKVEEPGVAFIYRLSDSNGHVREYAMRGIDSTWVSERALTPAGILSKPFFDAYISTIVGTVYGFNIPYSASPTVQLASIISSAPGASATVTTATAHGLSNGDGVCIRRVKDYPFANGVWRVGLPLTSMTFTLIGSNKFYFNSNFPGRMQKISPTYQQYLFGSFNEVSWRATGKPSFLPRGKSSPRLLHR